MQAAGDIGLQIVERVVVGGLRFRGPRQVIDRLDLLQQRSHSRQRWTCRRVVLDPSRTTERVEHHRQEALSEQLAAKVRADEAAATMTSTRRDLVFNVQPPLAPQALIKFSVFFTLFRWKMCFQHAPCFGAETHTQSSCASSFSMQAVSAPESPIGATRAILFVVHQFEVARKSWRPAQPAAIASEESWGTLPAASARRKYPVRPAGPERRAASQELHDTTHPAFLASC